MGLTLLGLAAAAIGGLSYRRHKRKIDGEITAEGAVVYELSSFVFLLRKGDDYNTNLKELLDGHKFIDGPAREMALAGLTNLLQEDDILQACRKRTLRSENPEALVRSCKRLFDTESEITTHDFIEPILDPEPVIGPVCLLGVVLIAPAFNTGSDHNDPANVLGDLTEAADLMDDLATYLYYWHEPTFGLMTRDKGRQVFANTVKAIDKFRHPPELTPSRRLASVASLPANPRSPLADHKA